MKKQTVNTIVKNTILSMFSLVLVLQAGANTAANPETNNTKDIEIHYAGHSNDNLAFDVKFANPSGKTFTLLVLDEFGQSLYKANYSNKNFKKKFIVPKDETVLTFVIQVGKEVHREKFDVNIRTQQIEDVVVKKG